MSNTGNFLLDMSDGLAVRLRGETSKGRLRFLDACLPQWVKAQRKARYRPIHYVDLAAGPGKIKFSPGGQILRSSALIALTAKPSFDAFWFAESYRQERSALDLRARTSPHRDAVHSLTGASAAAAAKVVQAATPEAKNPLYLVYLDLDNLSYSWETVATLASLETVAFLADFSGARFTSTNSLNIMFDKGQQEKLDSFFGDGGWRAAYRTVAQQGEAAIQQAMLTEYAVRLATLGQAHTHVISSPPNSKQPYTFLATSTTPFSKDLWAAVQRELRQPRLF